MFSSASSAYDQLEFCLKEVEIQLGKVEIQLLEKQKLLRMETSQRNLLLKEQWKYLEQYTDNNSTSSAVHSMKLEYYENYVSELSALISWRLADIVSTAEKQNRIQGQLYFICK